MPAEWFSRYYFPLRWGNYVNSYFYTIVGAAGKYCLGEEKVPISFMAHCKCTSNTASILMGHPAAKQLYRSGDTS